jgi:NAD(P)-dependent dehydrogenase (short-subunit alcohol dehydrogenase family)
MGSEKDPHCRDFARHVSNPWRAGPAGPAGAGGDLGELNPAGRAGEHDELANLCAYLVSDEAAYINGACVTIDGGRWLQGAGTFSSLSRLSEAEWQEMRARRSP